MAKKLGMVIDLDRCTACQSCSIACKAENSVPEGMFWHKVIPMGVKGEFPNLQAEFVPRPCMHCEKAPCVQVCPVGATRKDPDGRVLQNYERCIGCRYCMTACPYGVRNFNWKTPDKPVYENPDVPVRPRGVVEKCTMCTHRTSQGLDPACVQACTASARYFGDLNDPNSPASQALKSRTSYRLREELGTNPQIHYLPRA